ncbi:MAG: hypothetical protein AAF809_12825 [Bacteroidota bacterium]
MWETGPDEAFLIGSEDELRRFAQNILALLNRQDQDEKFLGIDVSWASGYLTEKLGDVSIVSVAVTADNQATKRLINAVKRNNGEAPIASVGWPSEDRGEAA